MVAQWSRRKSGKAPDPSEVRWELPATFDEETAGELAGSALATPYRALSMAVRNEERAFALWTYIAAQAEDPAIRQAAETMAREELEHVSLLRRARRRAYHAQRAVPARPSMESFEGAEGLEAWLADRFLRLAAELPAGPFAERARALAAQSRRMAE